MFTSTSSPAKLPDIVSPIYQKVLGCQLLPGEPSNIPSPGLDMTDPTVTLKTLFNTERPFRDNLSMTLPTSVFSNGQDDANSKTNTNSVCPSYSRLDDDHMFPSNEHTKCNEEGTSVRLLQKQELYTLCRSVNIHFKEKYFESMSNVLSPNSDGRLSEGDQTVPHSVSPATESPAFALSDECNAVVQATFVPPPEVLIRSSIGPVKSLNVDHEDLQETGVNGIHSLDNYEYFIHKVDQHSLEARGSENSLTAKLYDNIYDNEIVEKTTGKALHDRTFKNKTEVPIRIQIDNDEECYVIKNDMSKDVELIHDNIPVNDMTHKNKQMDNTCAGDKTDGTQTIITLDDDDDVQLDEEQSEMRRYYLEADKVLPSAKCSAEKQRTSYDSWKTSALCSSTLQNTADLGEINSVKFYTCRQSTTKQNASEIGVCREGTDIFRVCLERDMQSKEIPEKRYYLKDGSHNMDIEPGEIIHKSTEHNNMSSNTTCFNGDYISNENETRPQYSSQMRNCVTGYPEMIPGGYRQLGFMSRTSSQDGLMSLRQSFERQSANSGTYSTLQNAERCHLVNKPIGSMKATSQNYNSILFPVSINNGSFHEIQSSNNSEDQVRLKRKLHGDRKQTYLNPSSISPSVRCQSFQNETNSQLSTHRKYNHAGKLCSKISELGFLAKSMKNNKPSEKTARHLNGIIEKLWVSKTCSKNSSIGGDETAASKQDYSKSSVNISSVFTCKNPSKSKNICVKMFECLACGFQDKRYSGIEKHVEEKHRPGGCTCDSCGETLVNHCQCQGRIKISSKAIAFECNICKKQCRTRHGLRQHRGKKHGSDITSCLSDYQPPYTCTVCSEDQYVYSRYKQHMDAHGVSSPFMCKTCSKTFHSKNGLALHFTKVHRSRDMY